MICTCGMMLQHAASTHMHTALFMGINAPEGNKLEHDGHHNTPLLQLCLASEISLGESTKAIHHVAGAALVRSKVASQLACLFRSGSNP